MSILETKIPKARKVCFIFTLRRNAWKMKFTPFDFLNFFTKFLRLEYLISLIFIESYNILKV